MQFTRCFLAAELSGPAIAKLQRALAELRKAFPDEIRWVANDQLHLVLKPIGDVEDIELSRLCETIREAAEPMQAFMGSLAGFGRFPATGSPKNVWAKIGEGAQELEELHAGFDKALTQFGVAGERRKYRPNITLGRARRSGQSDELAEWLDARSEALSWDFDVDAVAVFSGDKNARGVEFSSLDRVELF